MDLTSNGICAVKLKMMMDELVKDIYTKCLTDFFEFPVFFVVKIWLLLRVFPGVKKIASREGVYENY